MWFLAICVHSTFAWGLADDISTDACPRMAVPRAMIQTSRRANVAMDGTFVVGRESGASNVTATQDDQHFGTCWQFSSVVTEATSAPVQMACGIFIAGFTVFSLFSIFWHADTPNCNPEGRKRDTLWDIVKFGLLVLVTDWHFAKTGIFHESSGLGARSWYAGFFMPGFFIVSGLFHSGTAYSYNSIKRLIRDNVLNAIILTLFFPVTLWFLPALAVYRLTLTPMLQWLQAFMGDRMACVSLLLLTGLAYWRGSLVLQNTLFKAIGCEPNHSNHYLPYAVFYVLGLTIDRDYLRSCLLRKAVLVLALAFQGCLIVFCYGGYRIFALSRLQDSVLSSVFKEGVPLDEPVALSFLHLCLRAFGALSFMACCAQLVDSRWPSVERIIAGIGSRTLYGYCLQMIVQKMRVFDPWIVGNISQSVGRLFGVLLDVLLVASLCSPLSERLFHWAISPQWIVDGVERASKGVRTT
eukprot:TRINITY_DN73211_c0_g1_i1.p1 TRINITY_DN73211_c0_g1~~TRINITY_DN73211_c0_g1_i1.p1  ORF type:complete len:467 (+),score=36.26 TRINITY_DN73211_c0_g1_i1:62-1462(+)